MSRTDVDVVVVGAGAAGLHAAALFAQQGRSVLVVDRRRPETAGPTWNNGVLPWQFAAAGLPDPTDGFGTQPVPASGSRLVSPDKQHVVDVPINPIVELDMRRLTRHLRTEADLAGAVIQWRHSVSTASFEHGRLRSIGFRGDKQSVSARLFIDASGMSAVLRSQHPLASKKWPAPDSNQVCRAMQYNYEVADRPAAVEFCDAWGARPGDSVSFMSPSNGFSVTGIRVSKHLDEVGVLVGTLEADSPRSAAELLAGARQEFEWIGSPTFGGGGRIPLGAPYAEFGDAGLALIGDSANQVMAAHGSGIGFGLIAASLLADAASSADDPGSGTVIDQYQRTFHRKYGALLGGYDLFRRMSSRIGPKGVQRLFDSGLFDADMAEPGLHQQMGSIPIRDIPRRARSLATNPILARQLGPTLLTMQAIRPLYAVRPPQRSRLYAPWHGATSRLRS